LSAFLLERKGLDTLNWIVPVKPHHLEYGDTIGIVAPASPPPDPGAIDKSLEAVRRLGFKPLLGGHARKRLGFLAGNDRERAGDLMRMFANPRVRAILCVRGGVGSGRLLPLLDFRVIRANSKILCGYSDITALHCAMLSDADLISFHGPMLNGDFIKPEMPDFTLQSFLRALTTTKVPGSILNGYRKRTIKVLRKGRASGRLIGGNLSLLCSMIGTRWQPVFKGRILLLEDVEEPPYRLDRMLTHLLNAGLLQQVAGVAIGINLNCTDPKAGRAREYRQTLEDVALERLEPLRIPVVMGLPFGHIPFNATIPIGAKATLDATNGDLVITESAVS
jgi:muramoyltetrapeptide carboxypeptidase